MGNNGDMMSTDFGEEWRAQVLRYTLFMQHTNSLDEDIWLSLTGEPAEVDERRVREATRRQAGPWRNGLLEVRVGPARIDVVLAPSVPNDSDAQLDVGNFLQELECFAPMVHGWLKKSLYVNVNRCALGAVLMMPSNSKVESYERMSKLVPSVKLDAENSKEFLYRINRPIESKQGFEINRITTWNALARRVEILQESVKTQISNNFFVRLELDFSTPIEQATPLKPENLVPIFEELNTLAIENARHGETP